jgi:hypothetical protein
MDCLQCDAKGNRETKKQGKEETRGYGLLPSTTLCQGSTQMDDLVAKQETIKRNGIFSIQDFSTSRARKLSSHGDLAYCPARRYFGENIYNFCPSRTEFATRLEVDWRKIDSFALSGETGKRRNSRVWISFNHNALPGYRKLGHRFNRFRDEGRQLLVFFSSVWRPKPHRTLLVSNRRDRWRAGNQGYGLLQLVQSTITRMSSY